MQKFLCIIAITFSIAFSHQLLSFNQYFSAIYAGTAIVETFSLLSKNVRHTVYGSKNIDELTQKTIRNLFTSFNFDTPSDIRKSHSFLSYIAGNIFSNHDSLFISKNLIQEIQLNRSLNDQTKKELVMAALMIKKNFDAKILAAYIATPIIVWTSVYCLHALLKKIDTSTDKKSLIKKIKIMVKQCKKSYTTKALISLLLTAAFISYERYSITNIANKLIKSI